MVVNAFRNFVLISLFIVAIIATCLYLSGILTILFIDRTPLASLSLEQIFSLEPLKNLWKYWAFWLEQRPHLNNEKYDAYYRQFLPNYFQLMLFSFTFVPLIILGILGFLFRAPLIDFRPFKKKESIHGDAKWANEAQIKKAGLREKKGMLLGKDKKGFLIAGGFQHALLFAPTGSGKGVGFVIPNLLFWEDSVVVHDIKLENWELTSGYRQKMGQKVFLWNPADPDGVTHCYNPIDWVSSKPGQMVDDVQKIANLILPEQEFWNNEARALFVGVVLYLLAVPEKIKSFGEVVRTLRSDDVVYNLAVVLDTIGKQIHPVAYMNIAAFLQKADKERSGVVSTLNSSLELWANPIIDTATATSDFNVMMFKRELHTIYVGLTPDNLTRLQPLMQVFYQQATEFLSRRMPGEGEDYGVMFMMDEFPTLGEMEQFKTGIAYFRGYRVRLFLIIQDTEQLKGIYEEAGMNSFLSNSTYRITFAANNMETANLISQLCGNKTVEQESLNKPKFFDLNPATRSIHASPTQRALLLPQEVIMLPRDEQILLIESSPPIKTPKIFYFKDKFFTKRLLPPTEVPTQEPYDPRKAGHFGSPGDEQTPPPEEQTPPTESSNEELPALEDYQSASTENQDSDLDDYILPNMDDDENENAFNFDDDENEDTSTRDNDENAFEGISPFAGIDDFSFDDDDEEEEQKESYDTNNDDSEPEEHSTSLFGDWDSWDDDEEEEADTQKNVEESEDSTDATDSDSASPFDDDIFWDDDDDDDDEDNKKD